jgi:hypothetical protein
VPEVVTTPSLSAFAIEWGPSLVLVRDHTAICGGQYGAKKVNSFCCSLLKGDRTCPARHAEIKHPWFAGNETLPSSRINMAHKSPKSNAVYAEPYVDTTGWTPHEVMDLLARIFGSLVEWKEEALVLNAARTAKQDVALLCTAVKATNWKKEVRVGSVGEEMVVKGELESSWDTVKDVVMELKAGKDAGPSASDMTLEGRLDVLEHALLVIQEVMDKGLKSLQLGFGLRCLTILGELQDQVAKLEDPLFVKGVINSTFSSTMMVEFSSSLKKAFVAIAGQVTKVEKQVSQIASNTVLDGSKEK